MAEINGLAPSTYSRLVIVDYHMKILTWFKEGLDMKTLRLSSYTPITLQFHHGKPR